MTTVQTGRKAYAKPSATKVQTAEAISGLAMACCAVVMTPTSK